jgi:hypothetical protein
MSLFSPLAPSIRRLGQLELRLMIRNLRTVRHSSDEVIAQPRIFKCAWRGIEVAHQIGPSLRPVLQLRFDIGMIVERDNSGSTFGKASRAIGKIVQIGSSRSQRTVPAR